MCEYVRGNWCIASTFLVYFMYRIVFATGPPSFYPWFQNDIQYIYSNILLFAHCILFEILKSCILRSLFWRNRTKNTISETNEISQTQWYNNLEVYKYAKQYLAWGGIWTHNCKNKWIITYQDLCRFLALYPVYTATKNNKSYSELVCLW